MCAQEVFDWLLWCVCMCVCVCVYNFIANLLKLKTLIALNSKRETGGGGGEA